MSSYLRQSVNTEAMHDFLKDKQAWEHAISLYQGPDPLDHWYNYVCWYENYGHGDPENKFRETLERCLSIFEHNDYYKQDVRMLRLWLKYIDMQPNPLHYYQALYQRGVARQNATFYLSWGGYFESLQAIKEAESVYNLGFQEKAQPYAELHHALLTLMYARAALQQQQQQKSALEQQVSYQSNNIHGHIQQQQQQQQQQQAYQRAQMAYAQQQQQQQLTTNDEQQYNSTLQQSQQQQQQQQQTNAYHTVYIQQQQQQEQSQSQQQHHYHTPHTHERQEIHHQPVNHEHVHQQSQQQEQQQPIHSHYQTRESNEGEEEEEEQHQNEHFDYNETINDDVQKSIQQQVQYEQQQQQQQQHLEGEQQKQEIENKQQVAENLISCKVNEEILGIKLPKRFVNYAKNNHELWKPALCLEEPPDNNRVCHYAKTKVYPTDAGIEYSPEELRFMKYFKSRFVQDIKIEEQQQQLEQSIENGQSSAYDSGSSSDKEDNYGFSEREDDVPEESLDDNYDDEDYNPDNAEDEQEDEQEGEDDEEEIEENGEFRARVVQHHYQQQQQQQLQEQRKQYIDNDEQIEASTIHLGHNKTIKIKFKKDSASNHANGANGNNYSAYKIERIYQQEVINKFAIRKYRITR